MTPVAVQGMSVIVKQPVGAQVAAVIKVLPPTGIGCRAGAQVHRDGDTISVSGITDTATGATTPDPVTYLVSMVSSAGKVRSGGEFVLLEGDESEAITARLLLVISLMTIIKKIRFLKLQK